MEPVLAVEDQAVGIPLGAPGLALFPLADQVRLESGERASIDRDDTEAAARLGRAGDGLVAAAGALVYATSRSQEKRDLAVEMGARAAFESGARLPERVDIAVETVGEATWSHSLRSLRPGGTVIIAGPPAVTCPPRN